MKTSNLRLVLLVLFLVLSMAAGHGGHDHDHDPEPTEEPAHHDDHNPLDDNPNLGLAFGLVVVGGIATALGGLVPFLGHRKVLPAFVESDLFLAGCMSLASGVLLFSSLYHILPESRGSFAVGVPGHEELATIGSFFFGAAIILLVEIIVHLMNPVHGSHDFRRHLFMKKKGSSSSGFSTDEQKPQAASKSSEDNIVAMEEGVALGGKHSVDCPTSEETSPSADALVPASTTTVTTTTEGKESPEGEESAKEDRTELRNMGLCTALAIAIHNLPESIATFVSTLNSPEVGVVLGIAIAIHHLPEGICIAMPIYFATKSKLKAFLVTLFLGGVTQPLAALLAYLVFATFWSPVANGVLTAMTAGMLVYVVVRNLFPTAARFDPKGRVVMPCFFLGVLIISVGLICFSYA